MMARWGPWLAVCGALAASVTWSPAACAHDIERERVDRPASEQATSTPVDETGADATGEANEPPFLVGLDIVLGFGKTLAADQTPPSSLGTTPMNVIDSDPVHADSFLFRASYAPLRDLAISARLPLTMGSILPDGYQARPISALGNVEIEGEATRELAKSVTLFYAIGIGLPTAQGAELPATTAGLAGRTFDSNAYDRYSILYAAAASRGFEENALFFPDRFGLVPKVALECRYAGRLSLEPFIKLENMISTSSDNASGYLAELVFGGRAAVRVNPYFEPGLRLWATVVVAGGDDAPVFVVEPEAKFHFGALSPYLGVLLPVAGPLAHDPSQFVGVRVGATLAF